MTLNAMRPDAIVVRHAESGAVNLLSQKVNCAVINGGDGQHEHPTQALLDALTIRRRRGSLEGLLVAICGDIMHSRVARSNIHLLQIMGARVRVVGPPTLMPTDIERMGVEVHYSMKTGLKDVDIVMMLRLQTERMQGSFVPSISEYFRFFGLDHEKLKVAKPNALIMHPGPMNRGVEIDFRSRRRPRPLGDPRAGRDGRGRAHGLPGSADRRPAQRARRERRREPQRQRHHRPAGAAAQRLDRLYQRPHHRSHGRCRVPGRGPDQRRQDRRLRPQPVRLGRALRHPVGRLPRPLSRARPGRHARPYRRAGRGAQGDAGERRRRRRRGRHHLAGAAARQRAAVRRCLADRVRRPPRPPDQAGEHVRLRRADQRARGQGAGRDRPFGRVRRRCLHRRRPPHRQRPGAAPRALLREGLRCADRPPAAGADPVGRPHDQRRDGDAARPRRAIRRSPR